MEPVNSQYSNPNPPYLDQLPTQDESQKIPTLPPTDEPQDANVVKSFAREYGKILAAVGAFLILLADYGLDKVGIDSVIKSIAAVFGLS